MLSLNEIFFLTSALIMWGLVAASKPLVNKRKLLESENAWFLAFVFSACAFSFFTIASILNLGLLTFANTCFVAGNMYLALFCRSLRKPSNKTSKWLPIMAILIFGLVFEYLRQRGVFTERVLLVVSTSSLCLLWQLIELGLLGKVRLKHLRLFFFITVVELILTFMRLAAIFFQQLPSNINLYQEPFELALIRWIWFALMVISYVTIIAYWVGRISSENLKTIEENNLMKLEIANNKILQSDWQLLTTLQEVKSMEVKLDDAENELLKREELLRYVLDISGDGIWDWNILTGEVKHNSRWIEMLGEDPGQPYFSVEDFKKRIHPDDLNAVLDQLRATLEDHQEYRYSYRMLRTNGRQIWVRDRGAVVEKSEDGKPIRMVGAISDISEEVATQEKLQELAFYDPLTQVLNRRIFEDRLDQTLKNSERHQQYCALLILDLDKFKNLNDSYGHQMGDLRLMDVAKRMKEIIREIDTIARIGGDEFSIILGELGLEYSVACEQAKKIAEKLCESLSNTVSMEMAFGKLDKSNDLNKYTCSVSIGVTVFLGNKKTQDELLSQADDAMYLAKKAGGNQVCFYSKPVSP